MADYIIETKPPIIETNGKIMLRVLVTGLIVGIVSWALTFLLDRFILQAIFCHDAQAAMCVSSYTYAGNIVGIIMAIVGVSVLVRLGVFRPLLIVLATLVSLWGLAGWVSDLRWFEALLWTAVLYAVCYVAYAWLARIRNAVVMVVIVAVVVVATRLVPMFLA